MISAHLDLEDFETGEPATPKESPDYARGVEDGRAAALSEADALQADALAKLANTLSDMTFGYEEARSHLVGRIAPILAQVAETVLPEILRDTFAQHLIDQVMGALGDGADMPLQIAVSAATAKQLEAARPPELTQFTFVTQIDLSDNQALILGGTTDIILDLPLMLAELQTALRGLEGLERTTTHG